MSEHIISDVETDVDEMFMDDTFTTSGRNKINNFADSRRKIEALMERKRLKKQLEEFDDEVGSYYDDLL